MRRRPVPRRDCSGGAVGAIGLSVVLLAPSVLAWGDAGHRIVGEIAWQRLDAGARERVRSLMTDPPYRTLYLTCTWADREARSDPRYEWLSPYHYVNVDTGARRYVAARDCPEGACVIGGIQSFAHRLADADAPHDERVLALRVVSHLVGDLHQPLHVTDRDSLGGNRVSVRYGEESVTVHALWDTTLVEAAIADAERRSSSTGWRVLARELTAELDGLAGRDDRGGRALEPEAWAAESLRLYRKWARDLEADSTIGQRWTERTIPVVRRRLAVAGVRLASLLQRIADGEPLPFDDPSAGRPLPGSID